MVSVDGGHRAVIFDRFRGVQDKVVGEGTHFLIPWVQKPIIFDIRSRPRNIPVATGSKGIVFVFIGKYLNILTPIYFAINEPLCEKTGLRGFPPGPTQTGLYIHRKWLEVCNSGYRK